VVTRPGLDFGETPADRLVRSVEALSQIVSSQSSNVCAAIESRASWRYLSPLKTGMPMDTFGARAPEAGADDIGFSGASTGKW
jgi:hypothetical protein